MSYYALGFGKALIQGYIHKQLNEIFKTYCSKVLSFGLKNQYVLPLNKIQFYCKMCDSKTKFYVDQTSSYEFPDEDFCAFIQLTRVRNVTTKIDGKESLECSCTLAWLLLNSNKSMETPTTAECFLNSTTISAELQRECNFTNRVFECERARATTPRTTTTTTTTTRVVEQKPKQDTTTIIFGVIGGVVLLIMIGIVVFYVYRNRSKQQKKEVEKINLDEDVNIVKTNN